jgi:Flp pilus assembly protein TadG
MPLYFIEPFSKLRSDDRGATTILFALLCTFMLLFVGLAVDFSRAQATSRSLTAALDAAALAAGRALLDVRLSESEVTDMAIAYFEENIKTGQFDAKVGTPRVAVDRLGGSVEIAVDAQVPTTLLALADVRSFQLPLRATAAFAQKDIELSMALDVTGSMSGSKIAALRQATTDLIDIMLPDGGTPNKVRVGLAPYDEGVNAGIYAAPATNGRSTRCTFERQGTQPNGYQAPSLNNYLKVRGDPGVDSTATCPQYARVMALTDDKVALKSSVANYTAGSSTAGHLGAQWASYLLAPEWSGVFGAKAGTAWGDDNTLKAMVLMTDGVFNTIGGRNYGDFSTQAAESQARARAICKNMRDKGVMVFSVGFKMSENPAGARENAINTLKDCAGAPDRYFDAENGEALRAAFEKIATRLTSLRLTH